MNITDIAKAVRTALDRTKHRQAVRSVSLFGSQLSGLATDTSDVDLLIEFDPEAKVGLFELYDLEQLFAEEMEHDIDLTTPDGLDEHIKSKVLAEAQLIYER